MWGSIAGFILRFRLWLLIGLAIACVFAGFEASRVELSYEYTRAIPTDNPKYLAYQNFRQKFGDDGNLLVMGIQTDKLFSRDFFNDYIRLNKDLKKIKGVEQVLSIPDAILLVKNDSAKLNPQPIFPSVFATQEKLDSAKAAFENQLFYR